MMTDSHTSDKSLPDGVQPPPRLLALLREINAEIEGWRRSCDGFSEMASSAILERDQLRNRVTELEAQNNAMSEELGHLRGQLLPERKALQLCRGRAAALGARVTKLEALLTIVDDLFPEIACADVRAVDLQKNIRSALAEARIDAATA